MFIIHTTPNVRIVHNRNHNILNTKPIAVPSKDIPLSPSPNEENTIFHGAADIPKVQIAINAFFLFSSHSAFLDMLKYTHVLEIYNGI